MSDQTPLTIKNFTKNYGSFKAIDDINIELKPGEVFGFLGPNGAGKSTTIRCILDFIRPSAGTIEIFGQDSVENTVEVKKRIGYLAGDIALYDSMTGQQLLQHLSKIGEPVDPNYVSDLATQLEAQLDRPIKTLSKGNKQKIGLIQAFMHTPDLLVLDEPTSGLDPIMKQKFYDLVKGIKESGKTVFVSSHDLSEVQKICDRAGFIRAGELVAVEEIKSTNLQFRKYKIEFKDKPPKTLAEIAGVSEVELSGKQANLTVTGNISGLIKELSKHDVVDLDEIETSLEDVFLHYYEEERRA